MPNSSDELKLWACLGGHKVYGSDAEHEKHPYCRWVDYIDNEPIACGLELCLIQEVPEEELKATYPDLDDLNDAR